RNSARTRLPCHAAIGAVEQAAGMHAGKDAAVAGLDHQRAAMMIFELLAAIEPGSPKAFALENDDSAQSCDEQPRGWRLTNIEVLSVRRETCDRHDLLRFAG